MESQEVDGDDDEIVGKFFSSANESFTIIILIL